jgi:SAM domain (Sterile alpha motif)
MLIGQVGENRQGAAMQRIADWLEKLGMSEYAQRFAENRIDPKTQLRCSVQGYPTDALT